MANLLAVVPTPRSDFVEMARSPAGRLYRKHLLKLGRFPHPADPTKELVIDPEFIDAVMSNFDEGVADIVQIPKVDGSNKHTEDPDRNLGEVVRLERRSDGGLDAIGDFRKQSEDVGKTLIGASAMLHMNYTDTRTGQKRGPTLLHMAITNRPYITGLDGFEEIVAASADTTGDVQPVIFAEEEAQMAELSEVSQEDLIVELSKRGVDVEELQARAQATPSANEFATEVLTALRSAGVVQFSQPEGEADGEAEEITTRDVAEAVVELAREKSELEGTVRDLTAAAETARKEKVEAEVDGLVKDGRILPKQREAMVEIALSNREQFDALLPEDSIVAMSEQGVTTHDATADEEIGKEIDRIAALANGES